MSRSRNSNRLLEDTVNQTSEREFKTNHWEKYSPDQLQGKKPISTAIFFDHIPKPLKSNFMSSTRRILQLGVGSGLFFKNAELTDKRECIGYDYAKTSIECATKNKVTARLVDLNEIKQMKRLRYQTTLNEDLSVPADILVINILEWLHKDALILLIFSLINTAKPGSTFYFEVAMPDPNNLIKLPEKLHSQFEINYLASFFPRTDVQFEHHSINQGTLNPKLVGSEGQLVTTERLILTKI